MPKNPEETTSPAENEAGGENVYVTTQNSFSPESKHLRLINFIRRNYAKGRLLYPK